MPNHCLAVEATKVLRRRDCARHAARYWLPLSLDYWPGDARLRMRIGVDGRHGGSETYRASKKQDGEARKERAHHKQANPLESGCHTESPAGVTDVCVTL